MRAARSAGRRSVALPLLLAMSVAAAACAGAPEAHLRLENGTDIPLAVHVNDAWVGTYEAGRTVDVPIRAEAPWRIEALSDSGAVLSALDASADDAARVIDGTRSLSATSDTPCGMIRITVGDAAEEPMPAPTSSAGPCP